MSGILPSVENDPLGQFPQSSGSPSKLSNPTKVELECRLFSTHHRNDDPAVTPNSRMKWQSSSFCAGFRAA